MFVDFVANGQAVGPVAERMQGVSWDSGLLRPYLDRNGVPCVDRMTGQMTYNEKTQQYEPVVEKARISDLVANGMPQLAANATTLRKDEWLAIDRKVIQIVEMRLRAWADLSSASPYGGFNGMSKLILEHETMSDFGEAVVDMEGMTEGRNDAPKFNLEGTPLPITHSDFWFSERQLAVSRNGGTPLDVTKAGRAARRVAETVEKTTIGLVTGMTYGGSAGQYGRTSKVYGYLNFPNRLTKTNLTVPTGSNPEATVGNVLDMISSLADINMHGPFMLYHSTDWTKYMDNDYARLGGNNSSMTLRDRLRKIESIRDVKQLDYMTPGNLGSTFNLLLVQMTEEVADAINGMDLTTLQWPSAGGMRHNFKVMCIWVPRIKADYYGHCGICHGTPS